MRSVRTRLLFVGAPLLAAAVAAVRVVRFAGGFAEYRAGRCPS